MCEPETDFQEYKVPLTKNSVKSDHLSALEDPFRAYTLNMEMTIDVG